MGIKYEDGNNRPRPVPFEGIRFVACCDCGLVHRHDYAVVDGKIVERVSRADRATAQIRRKMAKDGYIVAEKKANLYVILRRIVAERKAKKLRASYEPYR